MNPLEQAQALRKLVEFYGSQNKAAKRLGIGQSTISSKLSILNLDPELQADLVAGRRKIEHVRNLAKLAPEEQREKADARATASAEAKSPVVPRERVVQEAALPEPEAPAPTPITSTDQPGLSRRDNADVPELAPGQSGFAPLARVTKMPWHDGGAVAELVLRKMDSEQQQVLLSRLLTVHSEAASS